MKALVLLNTGSPAECTPHAVGQFIRAMLMDANVVTMPYICRWLLVNGVIVPCRKHKSCKKYESIWMPEGSPLTVNTVKIAKALKPTLPNVRVDIAMRYGAPSPAGLFAQWEQEGFFPDEVILFPLMPHYAFSSYETTLQYTIRAIKQKLPNVPVKFVKPYYEHPAYINALKEVVRPYVADGRFLLSSFHGLPLRHQQKAETLQCAYNTSYVEQTTCTTTLVAEVLGLSSGQYAVSYQSRMGKKWLQPFTEDVLAQLPKKGIKDIIVMSPSFITDNLETLYDIHQACRKIFLNSGGESYTAIPCLNNSPAWIDAISAIAADNSYLHSI